MFTATPAPPTPGACSLAVVDDALYYVTAPLPGHPNSLHFTDYGLNDLVHRLLSA
jgi:hypothetical protein